MDTIIKLLRIPYFRKSISVLIFTILILAFFSSGIVHLFIYNSIDKATDDAMHYVGIGDTISRDITSILQLLNSGKHDKCDDALINKMRTAQYRSDYAKDIGFTMNNELICTTGLGVLDEPFKEPKPQFTTRNGVRMWLNVPIKLFDFHRVGTVAKAGNFNVVVNIDKFLASASDFYTNTIYAKVGEGNFVYQSGDKNLIPEKNENYTKVTLNGFYSFMCSENSITCAMSYIPMSKAIQSAQRQLIGIFTLSFFSATFIALFLNSIMNKSIMFKNRFLRNMTHEDVICFYQPVIDSVSEKAVGCEVLVRWKDENDNIVTPDQFLDIVKQEKKTELFTAIIIDNAFKELNTIIKEKPKFKVAFNIFPVDFNHANLSKLFDKYRKAYPDLNINLELTEDQLVEAPKISEEINKLRKEGYSVSIDDFGTGYSSLSYLHNLTVDYIKIDRSFVKNLELGTVKSQLIPLIVSIAKTIDSDIIIEGVENAHQLEYVCEHGIEYIQGYYFSKPIPIAELTEYVKLKG